jgi:hypothetical protein
LGPSGNFGSLFFISDHCFSTNAHQIREAAIGAQGVGMAEEIMHDLQSLQKFCTITDFFER